MKPRTVIIGDNFAEELAHQLNLEAILVRREIFLMEKYSHACFKKKKLSR